jgi:hypothetical protein
MAAWHMKKPTNHADAEEYSTCCNQFNWPWAYEYLTLLDVEALEDDVEHSGVWVALQPEVAVCRHTGHPSAAATRALPPHTGTFDAVIHRQHRCTSCP